MPTVKGNSYREKLKASLEEVGFSFATSADCSSAVKITNYHYYCVQQLFTLNERRFAFLRLLGESYRVNEADLFNVNSLYNFDRGYIKEREKASRRQNKATFELTFIDLSQLGYFPSSSNPSDEPPPLLPRMAPSRRTVKKVAKVAKTAKVTKLIDSVNAERRLKYNQVIARKTRKALAAARIENIRLKNLVGENERLKGKNRKLAERCTSLDSRVLELEEKLISVIEELEILKKEHTESEGDKKVFLKSGPSFTPEANIAFGELSIMCSIPQDKVGAAILTIARLFNVEVDAVPSARTVGRSYFAVSCVCAKQIAELLEQTENLTVLSDETTKFYQKFQTYVAAGHNKLTGEDFLIHLGVFEVPDKLKQ